LQYQATDGGELLELSGGADRPVMTDGGYQGNPEAVMPCRKPRDGSDLPERKEDLHTTTARSELGSSTCCPG